VNLDPCQDSVFHLLPQDQGKDVELCIIRATEIPQQWQ